MQTLEVQSAVEPLVHLYQSTLAQITEAVKDIPAPMFTHQPGSIVNHPAWTLAHLNASAAFILQLLDEPVEPTAGDELRNFGPGSKPVTDPAAYLPKDRVLAQLADRHARIGPAVRAKHTDCFGRPSPEFVRAFAPTVGVIVTYLMGAHEAYHLGQLMLWRRAAGLAK